jgi:hypothetical protein
MKCVTSPGLLLVALIPVSTLWEHEPAADNE